MDKVKIGIFGGSFNPIHVGHLMLAETARETLGLDRVVLIPTHQPPHKSSREMASGADRLEMAQIAIRDNPVFVASDIELQRGGTSYSIDTVKSLRQQLPQAALFLMMGQDMLGVPWVGWAELKRLCTVVVVPRPGTRKPRKQPGLKWLAMPQVEIASSDIRKRVAAGRSIRYLVPLAVERFIQHRGLYRKGGSAS